MFTGIVQTKAQVFSINKHKDFLSISISIENQYIEGLEKGASVAINGVCLTAVDFAKGEGKGHIRFDVIDETLSLTNLSSIEEGDFVNVERSLKIGDEIGGHMVSGHIQAKASLVDRKTSENNCQLSFKVDDKWQKYLFEKGFISVNGVSLTLGKVNNGVFNLHLIPETLDRTNLNEVAVSQDVNIEFDQQTITTVDTIERYLAQRS